MYCTSDAVFGTNPKLLSIPDDADSSTGRADNFLHFIKCLAVIYQLKLNSINNIEYITFFFKNIIPN